MKINAKTFNAFRAAHRAGITFNDNFNRAEFGLTHAQYSAILRAVEEIDGMGAVSTVSLTALNKYLEGGKVGGARLDPATEERLRAAFSKV